jgi:hypothetical protein
MSKLITVYRDQAVWERETLEVEVPDDVPEDQHLSWIKNHLDTIGTFERDAGTEILGNVTGYDIEITIVKDQ